MIKLENYEVTGWEHAIRGMRNPMNSWEKSDSSMCGDLGHLTTDCPTTCAYRIHYNDPDTEDGCCGCSDDFAIGENDHKLMMKLAKGGSVHAKYRRMITVYVDITAPLYWWKEFDTYKVGTVANSCSTMHKIHDKEFDLGDFSHEHLINYGGTDVDDSLSPDEATYSQARVMKLIISSLNGARDRYLDYKARGSEFKERAKEAWWQMIQLLPSSYNQKRTVMLNYEVLVGIYEYRKNHKLDEWVEFCEWIETLPYSEIITGGTNTCDGKNEVKE